MRIKLSDVGAGPGGGGGGGGGGGEEPIWLWYSVLTEY